MEPHATDGGTDAGSNPSRQLDQLFTLDEFQILAREQLDPSVYAYIASGAGDDGSVEANRRSLQRWRIIPRAMRDVSTITTGTTVLGSPVKLPLLIAPSAMQRLSHPSGELGMASAAMAAGVPMVLSMNASTTMEDVAATGVPLWFQLYVYRDRKITEDLVARAEAAGVRAICITIDQAVMPWRVRELRSPLRIPAGIDFANLPAKPQADALDPGLTWESLGWIRDLTDLPLVLKGILDPSDAALASEHGADAIIVSNHGGRQISGSVSAWDMLPAIADRVGDSLEVLADGGIRDGVDIFRAIALGARAVLLGRPAVWGLAVAGQQGVERVLEILASEFRSVLGSTGCTSPAAVDADRLLAIP